MRSLFLTAVLLVVAATHALAQSNASDAALAGFVRDATGGSVQRAAVIAINTTTGERLYNVNMAATILTSMVPLVIYLVSGRWFVRGIAAGAVKG